MGRAPLQCFHYSFLNPAPSFRRSAGRAEADKFINVLHLNYRTNISFVAPVLQLYHRGLA
jgi:hypothetical protein